MRSDTPPETSSPLAHSRRTPQAGGCRNLGSFQHCLGNARGLLAKAVAPQTPCDDRVVVRPDRADVVADRIVAALRGRHRPYAPARKQSVAHQMLGAGLGLVIVDDAAPQEMANVGRERIDPSLLAVEPQGKEAALRDPKVLVKALLQQGGLLLERVRPRCIAPHVAREPGGAQLGVVCVALELAGGARS